MSTSARPGLTGLAPPTLGWPDRVVDTHVHVWDPVAGYSWLSPDSPLAREFTLSDLYAEQADRAPSTQVILVEASRGDDSEAADLLALADRQDKVLGAVVRTDLRTNAGAIALRRLLGASGGEYVLGVRQPLETPADAELVARRHRDLADHGVVVELNIPWHRLGDAVRLAERLPGVCVVLNHCGGPPDTNDQADMADWRRGLLDAAQAPTIHVKLAGMLTWQHGSGPLPPDQMAHIALDAFGADRVMLGSDWPVCRTAGSWHDSVHVGLTAWSAWSSSQPHAAANDTLRALAYGTAESVYQRAPRRERSS